MQTCRESPWMQTCREAPWMQTSPWMQTRREALMDREAVQTFWSDCANCETETVGEWVRVREERPGSCEDASDRGVMLQRRISNYPYKNLLKVLPISRHLHKLLTADLCTSDAERSTKRERDVTHIDRSRQRERLKDLVNVGSRGS